MYAISRSPEVQDVVSQFAVHELKNGNQVKLVNAFACISMHCQSHRANKNNLSLHEELCGALKKEREREEQRRVENRMNRTEVGFSNISGLKHLPIRVILPAAPPKIWGSSNPFHRLCDAVNPPARSSLFNFSLLLHSSCNFSHFRCRPPATGDVISQIFPLRDAVIFLFPLTSFPSFKCIALFRLSASFKKKNRKRKENPVCFFIFTLENL